MAFYKARDTQSVRNNTGIVFFPGRDEAVEKQYYRMSDGLTSVADSGIYSGRFDDYQYYGYVSETEDNYILFDNFNVYRD